MNENPQTMVASAVPPMGAGSYRVSRYGPGKSWSGTCCVLRQEVSHDFSPEGCPMISANNLLSALLLGFACVSYAQTDQGARGPIPPGLANDRPSDGAITGGPLMPGESGGVPNSARLPEASSNSALCLELTGALREECLMREQNASGGSSAPTEEERRREPPVTPSQQR